MIIGINGNEANVLHRVGVGQYAYELLQQFAKFKTRNSKFEIYLSAQPRVDMPKLDYEVFGPKKLWTLTGLQRKLITNPPDVLFTPTHYTPLYVPCPSVISIMDMSFERYPYYFKKNDLCQLKYWTRFSAIQAKKILTISRFSRNEICDIYGFSPDKIVVTYPGFDTTRFNPEVKKQRSKTEKTLDKYKIGRKGFLLFLGTLQPRKNLERLIEAYARLSNCPWKLVVVGMISEGRGGWKNEGIFAKVKSLRLTDKVLFTGYIPDEDVPFLMAESIAYLLPSLYEGFGIPPIEAMAVGTTVVVSRVSSLPEICGKAAFYIDDPYSVDNILQILRQIQKMPAGEYVRRSDLGLKWVKRYNWETTAKKTLEVLYEAAEK